MTSLEVAALAPLTSLGETVQLSVTARISDGSSRDVDSSLVEWRSSDPWVASVSVGIVTAVGGGNAVITGATYDGRTVEAPVSVRISTRSTGAVRVIYAVPSDREFQAGVSEFIAHAIVDLQSWYRRELGGLTFSIYETTPEVCRMNQTADYYATGNAWDKVVGGVQHCARVQRNHPDFVWVCLRRCIRIMRRGPRVGRRGKWVDDSTRHHGRNQYREGQLLLRGRALQRDHWSLYWRVSGMNLAIRWDSRIRQGAMKVFPYATARL